MFWIGTTAFFALLCLVSVVFALRGEERRVSPWLVAVTAAWVCGISFGNFVQDGRLTAHIDLLTRETERLQADNVALSEQLRRSDRLPIIESEPTAPDQSIPIFSDDESDPPTDANVANLSEPTHRTEEKPQGDPSPENRATTRSETSADPGTANLSASTPTETGSVQDTLPSREVNATSRNPVAQGGGAEPLGETAPPSLSGSWELRTIIEETSYPSFLGTQLTFRVNLTQTGERLQAEGEKLSEQSTGAAAREYAPDSRTPITLEGAFLGERLVQLAFEERGSLRSSGGDMLLTVVSPERLEGSFSSNAAGSAGRVVFEKIDAE